MRGWKYSFKLFLLFLFVFVAVVVGKEDIVTYVKENLFRTATYFLFTAIVVYSAAWQRRKRSTILPKKYAVLPTKKDGLFMGRVDDNIYGMSIEIFRRENYHFDGGSDAEYFAYLTGSSDDGVGIGGD